MTDWNSMPKHIIANDFGLTSLIIPFSIFNLKNSSNLFNIRSVISDIKISFYGSSLTSSIATQIMLKSSSERLKIPKNEILRYSSISSSSSNSKIFL